MLEIDNHHRLVKHIGHGENCWMGLQLSSGLSCYKRAVWKPITPLLDKQQAEIWLSATKASAEVLMQFKTASDSSAAY